MGETNGSGISRAAFIKGGLLTAGAAAAAAAIPLSAAAAAEGSATSSSATSFSQSGSASQADTAWDYETDVAIVGSGLGGFAAAFGAHENGASTVIVEVSTTSGGGSSFCGGMLHKCATGETDESYDEYTDYLNKDRALAHAYFNDFPDFISWLVNLGLDCTPKHLIAIDGQDWGDIALMGDGTQGIQGCRGFFDSCEDLYAKQGGTLLFQTVAQHILTDADGNIIGLQCRDNTTQKVVRIKAPSVVLATGGFQNDEEMRTRYWGHWGSMATIHAVPYATGSGLKMAQELGATMQGSVETFAGNYAPAYPAKNLMCDPAFYESCGYPDDGKGGKYWLYDNHLDFLADGSIFVNLDGFRFCDEGMEDYLPQQAIVRQRHATAIMVADDTVFQDWWTSPTYTNRTIQEEFEDCILSDNSGGSLFQADTLEDLADQLVASKIFAVSKDNFLKTIDEYNQAVDAGTTAQLDIPRELGNIAPITTAPFHAYPVTISVYAPFGGLAVDSNAQVLDKNREPIPGLYASFPAAGGFMREVYTGSVGCAGVTGRWAGRAAANEALGKQNAPDTGVYTTEATPVDGPWSSGDSKPASITGAASASSGASSSASGSAVASASAASVAAGSYKDGTYTGTGTGMGGKINVTLQISGGKITVTDISPNNETPGIGGYEAINDGTFKSQIEAAQSADIEGVSGASVTSSAIKKAVQDALAQAAA